MRQRVWIVTVGFAAIVTTFFLRFHSAKPYPDVKTVSAAEDEIYEAVVRDMVTPQNGQTPLRQLVFDEGVRTYLDPGVDRNSCKATARHVLRLESSKPYFDSMADKLYRLVTFSHYDSLRADTIRDFLHKSCTAGPLSQRFHTDLPRTFVPAQKVHFSGFPVEEDGPNSFERLFPGAGGIISLSRVGFDRPLDEAIVSTGVVCGALCGSGYRYILKKKSGRWLIVNKLLIWVS